LFDSYGGVKITLFHQNCWIFVGVISTP